MGVITFMELLVLPGNVNPASVHAVAAAFVVFDHIAWVPVFHPDHTMWLVQPCYCGPYAQDTDVRCSACFDTIFFPNAASWDALKAWRHTRCWQQMA